MRSGADADASDADKCARYFVGLEFLLWMLFEYKYISIDVYLLNLSYTVADSNGFGAAKRILKRL